MSGTRITLDQLPAKYAAQVAAQLGNLAAQLGKVSPKGPSGAKKTQKEIRISQKRGSGSKLEEAFKSKLLLESGSDRQILGSVITLQIGNGVRYTPDAWALWIEHERSPGLVPMIRLRAYEVKGPRAWDDSIVKLKVAARAYPWIIFHIVTRSDRNKPFKIVPVLP